VALRAPKVGGEGGGLRGGGLGSAHRWEGDSA